MTTRSASLKQGDTNEVLIGIKRGKNFDQDVTLMFADLPRGVTLDPESPVIKHGDSEAKCTLKAQAEAPKGDFTVKVTGHPTKGADASHNFKLTVIHMDTFTLSKPSLSTPLKQGGRTEVSIGIKRDKDFDQDVTLTFADLPRGVTLDPENPVIHRKDTEAKCTLKAQAEAPLGDFTVKIAGHPTKGADASHDFKLTVAHMDTFTLTVPFLSSTLKQGDTKEVSIGIKRDKDFDQDVALTFADLPKGVTLDPPSPVIKHGETAAKLTFKAAADASLGDFGVKITGHPTKGADATQEFKLTVAKK